MELRDLTLVEEYSRSTSLTVFEIHHSSRDIIPGYLMANMMSPSLWEWRKERPMHENDGKLRATNRRLKDMQRQFHWYTFTNDMSKPGGDYWGLLHFDEEAKRLGESFINEIRSDYDETLRYLLAQDPQSQFGQIVLQDFYKKGFFPRLKNETIEGMNAYQRISHDGKGSGKCVALAMLWAASLAVCGHFPLDQIIIVANKAHLFVFIDDGDSVHLFNNSKWYNSTRIHNDSELAVQARNVTTGSDVMFIYIPAKGMCDIFNRKSEIERSTVERVAERCGQFLGKPLRVGNLDEVEFAVNEKSIPDPTQFDRLEDYQKEVYRRAREGQNNAFSHAIYAYRDWRNTTPSVYAHAALREYMTGEKARQIKSINEALAVIQSLQDESIFSSRDRIALPDETLLFKAGDDRDKALLLFSLLRKSHLHPGKLMVGFSEHSSYVCCDDLWIDVKTLQTQPNFPEGLIYLFNEKICLNCDDLSSGNLVESKNQGGAEINGKNAAGWGISLSPRDLEPA